MKLLTLALLILIPAAASADTEFSPGHRALQRHFEAHPAFATHKAIWLRYNRLMLSANTQRVSAKALAKNACQLLLENGFRNIDVAVAVNDHRDLLLDNTFSGKSERYCER